jgi:hypothetical protein
MPELEPDATLKRLYTLYLDKRATKNLLAKHPDGGYSPSFTIHKVVNAYSYLPLSAFGLFDGGRADGNLKQSIIYNAREAGTCSECVLHPEGLAPPRMLILTDQRFLRLDTGVLQEKRNIKSGTHFQRATT